MKSVGLILSILLVLLHEILPVTTSFMKSLASEEDQLSIIETTSSSANSYKSSKNISPSYTMENGYDKNLRPSTSTDVSISLYINRISAVDETKEEISFDTFLQVAWEDSRIKPIKLNSTHSSKSFIELRSEERHTIWIPDLYIRQLREMRVLKLFEELTSLRLYNNSTLSLTIGATIIIKCDMDFVLYPLDVQKCMVDFSSYKYTVAEMTFRWKKQNNLTFPNDFNEGFFRLPRYVVSFETEKEPCIVNYGEENHYSARLAITLSREIKSYLLENYLPSTLFVSMSWGSFVVVPEIVPGRMVLLVTTLLSLVTMFDTVRNNSPDALELKCLEVWLISCTIFVFLALMEYFIVLFGIRYDKHWRCIKPPKLPTPIAIPPTPQVTPKLLSPTTTVTTNPVAKCSEISTASVQYTTQVQQRKNGIETTNRLFAPTNKIIPDTENQTKHHLGPNISQDEYASSDGGGSVTHTPRTMSRRRFRNAAEYAVLYAGSQRGKLDQISLILFPICFLLFTIIYWTLYLSEARRKM